MIRRLRQRHRFLIVALGLVTAWLVLAGLRARRAMPINETPLPEVTESPR